VCTESREEHSCRRIKPKGFGSLKFHVQGEEEECKNKKYFELLDLTQNSRQPLDLSRDA
jgi:hypothetical protein